MKKTDFYHKLLSGVAAFSLLLQSFMPTLVLAQEVSDTLVSESAPVESEVVPAPSPSSEADSTQEQPAIEPTPVAEPSPDVSPTPTSTSTPAPQSSPEESPNPSPEATIDQPSPAPTPSTISDSQPSEDQVSSIPQPETELGQANAPPAENSAETPAETSESPIPQPTADVPSPSANVDNDHTQKGQLAISLLENTDADSLELDLTSQDSITSASLTTDKADYAPTDTAVITGSDFPKEAKLKLIITADNYRYETEVQTDANGTFTYFYQLDGVYRPLYIVEAYDLSGALLATVSFTDAPPSGGSYNYTLQGLIFGQDPNNESSWSKGNLCQSSSGCYTEGDDIPGRLTVSGLTAGVTYTVVIQLDYDDGSGHLGYLSLNNDSPIRADTGATGTTITLIESVPCGGGVTCKNYNVTFTATNETATVYWDSRLSVDAALWNGASLHFRLESGIDGESVGNKEGPVQVSQLLFLPSLTMTKVVDSGSATPDQWCFNVSPSINGISQFCILSGQSSVSVDNVPSGTYLVTETGPSDYNFAAGLGTNCTFQGSSATATVASGDPATSGSCTFHNSLSVGTIVVHKDVQGPNGEDIVDTSANFTVRLDGSDLQLFTDGGTAYYNNVAPGAHTVTEDVPPTGYDFYSITDNGQINVPAGGTVDVYVVNRQRSSSLTLVKLVVNDNGGNEVADDFQGYINGNPVPWNVSQTLPAGSYTASEGLVSGYSASSWGGDCTVDGSVSLALGENKTCYLTNDDQSAAITLIKVASNSFGGDAVSDDFNLTIDGNVVLSGSTTQVGANVPHTISESQISGYTFVSISGDEKCPGVLGGTVTLNEGEQVTCVITNQDIAPTITLIKNVINDDGGTAVADDFDLTLNGSIVLSGFTTSVLSNLLIAINETLLSGYNFVSISGDSKCPDVLGGTVTLNEGENITCYLTNDDIAPKLKLTKLVINDNGGTATASDWILTASGTGGFSASGDSDTFHQVLANQVYTLSESGPAGYTASSWSCNGGNLNGNQLTLDLAEEVTCYLTNDDNVPSLTLVKRVINNNGGTAQAGDWLLEANGPTPVVGSGGASSGNTFQAGTYTLSESGPAGYTASNWNCTGGVQNGNQVTIGLGEQVVCEITNDDNGPSLTLVKNVVNDNGGSAVAGNWTLSANGPTPISGAGGATSDASFQAGTYTLSESGGPTGYTASAWTCAGGVQNGNQITIGLGDQVSCEITNDDISPQLVVIKHVINDNGGTLDASDFTMLVLGDNVSSPFFAGSEAGTAVTSDEGAYSVGEIEQDGYGMSLSGDCTGTISAGQVKTCTVTNDDRSATLIVRKVVVNDDGGTDQAEDFSFQVNEGPAQSFETDGENVLTVNAGTYDITEPVVSGYRSTFDNCEGISLPNDGTAICTITNDDIAPNLPPTLALTKTNNRLGSSVSPGADVLYTLTISLSGSALNDVSIIDLLPEGFRYRGGSYSAASSLRGDLRQAGITVEPVYASPGVWQLGDMVVGETVTIALLADIDGGIDWGVYKDLSWAKGTGAASGEVLANQDSGIFVGTEVAVNGGMQGASYQVEEKVEEKKIKLAQVLGVSNELPVTGISNLWVILAINLLISGSGLLITGMKLKRRKHE